MILYNLLCFISPTSVTYVIAVVSIYMGFLEAPPILIRNLYFPTKVIYFRNKTILILFLFYYFSYSSYTVTCSLYNSDTI